MGAKVHIVDCTIRDGGYLFDKNSEPEFVKGILQGLVDAGIDYMETGFLQSKVNGETIVDGDIRKACQGHNVAPDGGNENPYTVDHRNHPGMFNKKGHIGFLGHGAGVKFRNVRVRELK